MSEPQTARDTATDATDVPPERPRIDLGVFGRAGDTDTSTTDLVAAGLTLVWLLVVIGVYFFVDRTGAGGPPALLLILSLLAVFLPIVLIWVVATIMRAVTSVRSETARLRTAVDGMRHAYVAFQHTAATGGMRGDVEKKLDEIAAAQRKTEVAIATFTSRRDSAVVIASADRSAAMTLAVEDGNDQPGLALGAPPDALGEPIDNPTFIRALNFPENTEDRAGFRALRRALEDPAVVRLVRAAQDVLTLLSEEGIYMDDLKPDRARPEIWRKFAAGERGRAIASLGGIRDRSSLALTSGRMRQDPVFRDAAHHFLRTFDKTFASFEGRASDQDIADLAETRTARAFMLIGRVTGTFD